MSLSRDIPIYIVSKGRADTRLTAKTLEAYGVPFYMVVEAQELETYAAVVDRSKLLVLDPAYQERYETYDDLGATKSRGPGPARNFAWDHALAHGSAWHWVMDDNIRYFYRYHQNMKSPVGDGACFRAMEAFVHRYANIAMAGPNYCMFAPRKRGDIPPLTTNTRIYSCNLIRNDVPFRWRGRYNEDTDLSLQMLKAGWATLQFNSFLQGKTPTQILKGGNTADFYAVEGTSPKSEMLVRMHPDVARLMYRFSRAHHYVDYSPFKRNPLMLRRDAKPMPDFDFSVKVLAEDEKDPLRETLAAWKHRVSTKA